MLNLLFFINSILLGVGLAMDAFSVSVVNGLNTPDMEKKETIKISGVFAFFQWLMPLTGWLVVNKMAEYFAKFNKAIPWISMILLVFIGGKMLVEGIKAKNVKTEKVDITVSTVLLQGIATSIDALSVGFTIAKYNFYMVFLCTLIIAIVTFIICLCGTAIGKKIGTKLSNKAEILGGLILIFIGIETWCSAVV